MRKRRMAVVLPFERDERYSVMAIFATMIVALLLAAGAALDYARVANMREGIEWAVRSASQASMDAMHNATLTDAEIETIALSHFDKGVAFARHVGTIELPAVSIDRAAETVKVDAKGTVAMTVSRLFGLNEVTVPASSTSSWTQPKADAQDNAADVAQIARRF
ncbi:MAG TPA: hypothetical protein PKE16_01100 [Hyphomicrobium sp.]|nr:hypothetical protein [Hyphomicrobium sp.]